MKQRKYPPKSWIDPRIEVKKSGIEGKGLFTNAPIKAGDVIEIFGGKLFTKADIEAGKHRPYTLLSVDEGLYLGLPKDATDITIDEYTNHSCDPSTWLNDEITLAARRDIKQGEEITMDYATWEDDQDYVYFTDCQCGSRLCRHIVSGNDWKIPQLQERYKNHFSPFIQHRINSLL